MAGETDDEYEDEDDVNAVDDDYAYAGCINYEYDYDYEGEEENEDQVAYVDEEGWFHADEDTINVVDEQLAQEDDEFAAILTTYTEARGALAKARNTRGFYPVVVPADMGPQARYGRKGTKCRGNRNIKAYRQKRTTTKRTSTTNHGRKQSTTMGKTKST